ncbi:MAG: hypothetical protein A3F80_01080 [Candidatus Melainabacteria bacterium RIFCSPLOWO2_12_FULL_35_11]|nr:MAG: hypothetical protein A3F80_01080 [Candidatus Melainabacteria bacterium RIFCSPLOWO2_12_FULL_35_11]
MQNIKTDKNLKDEQYYVDLYDCHTMEECCRLILKFSGTVLTEEIQSKYSVEAQIDQLQKIIGITLNCFCGERYIDKAKTIQEWMDRDRSLGEFLESAQPPKGVLCIKCNSPMDCTDKHLYGVNDEKVLFFFSCNKCCKNRAFFDNGEEFKTIYQCPKCGEKAKTTHSRKKNTITTKYKCLHCKFTETGVLDLDDKTKEIDEIINEHFAADKKRFCLSKEEGEKYINGKDSLIRATDRFKELKEREKQKDLYDAVANVKKLNVTDLENHLTKALEKENFKKFELLKPDIGRIVVIGFTLQDTSTGIHEHTRRMTLKKTIDKALMETNWKLVEDSISYKLGFLSGRIRGFELEDDLVKMVQVRKKKLEKK